MEKFDLFISLSLFLRYLEVIWIAVQCDSLSLNKPEILTQFNYQLNSKYNSDFLRFRQYLSSITDLQAEKLVNYCAFVAEWNEKVNLISRKDIDNIVERHLVPSLAIALIKEFKHAESIIDVGTGGGFPGFPLSIINPTASFTLLDSNGKKIQVLNDIARRLDCTNIYFVNSRSESYRDKKFKCVLGRGVAALPKFLSQTSHLIDFENLKDKDSAVLYIKGGAFHDELKEAKISLYEAHSIGQLLQNNCDKSIIAIPRSEMKAYHLRNIGNV